MGQVCTVCKHPKRAEIDKALVAPGASVRAIAHQYGVGRDSLNRHVKNGHLIDKIKKVQQAQDIAEADDLLDEILDVAAFAKHMREATVSEKIALEANRDLTKILELKGKIVGAFSKDNDKKGTLVINIDKEDAEL